MRPRDGLQSGSIRTAVKQSLAAAAHYTGLRRASAMAQRVRCGGRRVLILGYHRVLADLEPELARSISTDLVSARTFQLQLEAAARAGFEFASMTDAVEVLTRKRTAKKDLCVVTFDDGYRDAYRYAFPLLRAKGIPAIFYLPAALIGTARRLDHDRLFHLSHLALSSRLEPKTDELPPLAAAVVQLAARQGAVGEALEDCLRECPSDAVRAAIEALATQLGTPAEPEWGDLIDWDEARRLAAAGYELGGHTLEHVVLTLQGPTRIEREVAGSKQLIERQTGSPVQHFCYCNGWYSEQLIRCISRLGFASAVTTEDYPNRLGDSPFTLKRKVLWEKFSIGLFRRYSAALTSCHVDGLFRMFNLDHPVPGKRDQRLGVQAWEFFDRKKAGPSPAASESLRSTQRDAI